MSKGFYILVGIIILTIALVFIRQNVKTNSSDSIRVAVQSIGTRTKTEGCVSKVGFPDKDCTPGAIISTANKEQICQSGYSKKVRNVSTTLKEQVYQEYGVVSHTTGEYEVDHHISLELGGSNDIANLWPEPADPRPGFHEKDTVENYLHKEVCDGKISLEDAQKVIANDWITVYQQLQK